MSSTWSWGGFARSLLLGAVTGAATGGLTGGMSASGFNGAVIVGSMNGAIAGGIDALFSKQNFFTGLYKGAVMGAAIGGVDIERERMAKEKNYLTGFLGSIVFSIPGIIVWSLFAIYLKRLASGMVLIITYLELIGYDYFKGRHGKLTKYIIVFTNIVSIIIANTITIIALLVKEGSSINHAILEFQTSQVAKNVFTQNIIISFILAFLIWIWLLFIKKDKKLIIKLADKF